MIPLEAPVGYLLLPVETNIREFESRVLLAAVAAERGLGALIGRAAELPQYLRLLPPSTMLYMNVIFPEVMRDARAMGHVPVALDEEGLVYRDTSDYLLRRVRPEALEACDRFFAWGQTHRRAVLSKVPHLADRVVATGNPRMDLLRQELQGLYLEQAAVLTKRFGRFVLVNTNFSMANHLLGPDTRVREWKRRGWADTDWRRDFLDRQVQHQEALFEAFVSMIEMLSRQLPDHTSIVLRPHPSESEETWRQRLSGAPRTHVIHEGSVIPWLLACEALIHNSCSTGIEGTLLGRPVIAYMPVRDELVECALPNEVSQQVTSEEEIVSLVERLNQGEGTVGQYPPLLDSHVSNLSGRLACDAIMDEIVRVSPPPAPLGNPRLLDMRVTLARWAVGIRTVLSGVRHGDRRDRQGAATYVRRASPSIDVEEVRRLLGGFARALDRFADVVTVPLAADLVLVASPGHSHRRPKEALSGSGHKSGTEG